MPFAKLDLLTLSHDLFFNIIVIFLLMIFVKLFRHFNFQNYPGRGGGPCGATGRQAC